MKHKPERLLATLGEVLVHLCASANQTPVHFRRRRNLIRPAERVSAEAILFILEARSKKAMSISTGHVLKEPLEGMRVPPRLDGALAAYSTGEATMPPENSLDEFEIALHQAWEILRGCAGAPNDLVHPANTSKEHTSQDHTDSEESDLPSTAAG